MESVSKVQKTPQAVGDAASVTESVIKTEVSCSSHTPSRTRRRVIKHTSYPVSNADSEQGSETPVTARPTDMSVIGSVQLEVFA